MAKSKAGSLRHIWASQTLTLKLKLRLYTAACCSIMTYGAEAWILDAQTCRILRGVNAFMLSHITGRTKRQEASEEECTFAIIPWIRARRLRWVGHILRMSDPDKYERPRLVKQALRHIYNNAEEGDLLMDTPKLANSWEELQKLASNRGWWRAQVEVIKDKCKLKWHKHKHRQDKDVGVAVQIKSTFDYEYTEADNLGLRRAKTVAKKDVTKKKKKKVSKEHARENTTNVCKKKQDSYEKQQNFFAPKKQQRLTQRLRLKPTQRPLHIEQQLSMDNDKTLFDRDNNKYCKDTETVVEKLFSSSSSSYMYGGDDESTLCRDTARQTQRIANAVE